MRHLLVILSTMFFAPVVTGANIEWGPRSYPAGQRPEVLPATETVSTGRNRRRGASTGPIWMGPALSVFSLVPRCIHGTWQSKMERCIGLTGLTPVMVEA